MAADLNSSPPLYGYLTVSVCVARGLDPSTARVFLDGVDVTHLGVQAVDDVRGFIEFFKRDDRGALYFPLARERRSGRVEVTFS